VANAPPGYEERLGDSRLLENFAYKEVQIHGDIDLKKHVQRLVVSERHHTRVAGEYGETQVRALCQKHNWQLVWMEDERRHRLMEERRAANPKGIRINWATGGMEAISEVPDVLPDDMVSLGADVSANPSTVTYLQQCILPTAVGTGGAQQAKNASGVLKLAKNAGVPSVVDATFLSGRPLSARGTKSANEVIAKASKFGLGSLTGSERELLLEHNAQKKSMWGTHMSQRCR
jgi:hypothetical protein